MKTIEKTITLLNGLALGNRERAGLDPRAMLVVTLLYLIAVLSVPVVDPGRLVWFFVYPIVLSEWVGTPYIKVFAKSLWILPIVILVGAFNPIIDNTPLIHIGEITLSKGWISLISIVLRGLLSMQALLVFTESCGFRGMCKAMQGIGVPRLLVSQLWMLYRYIIVLLQEALTMQKAREARGYGRKHYPLRMWGTFVGQLLIRSIHRARRINQAMEARGFTGKMVFYHSSPLLQAKDFIYIAVWGLVFFLLRHYDLSSMLGNLILNR